MTFGQCPASAEAAKRAIGAFPIAAKAPNWLQNVYFLASHQDRQRRSDRALHQVVLLGDNGCRREQQCRAVMAARLSLRGGAWHGFGRSAASRTWEGGGSLPAYRAVEVASVEVESNAKRNPSRSRGGGGQGWGFHRRNGYATAHSR